MVAEFEWIDVIGTFGVIGMGSRWDRYVRGEKPLQTL